MERYADIFDDARAFTDELALCKARRGWCARSDTGCRRRAGTTCG